MFQLLFVLFIIIPIIEITVIMQVGALLGAWPTVAIVILSAWLGAKYVRQQGLATLQSVQTKMAQGQMPSSEIVTGLMLLVAGVLLVTPGFVTDIFGLSLLIPSVRSAISSYVQKHIKVNHLDAGAAFHQRSPNGFSASGKVYQHEKQEHPIKQETKPVSHHEGETLEGEYQRKN